MMSNFKALIFIIKAIIDLGYYITGKIDKASYIQKLDEMSEAVTKASSGELPGRLEGGSSIEDQINRHAGGK